MKVRIAKKSEPYIKSTMVTPLNSEIVLREKRTFHHQKIEGIIEDILIHESIHLAIYNLFKDEIIAYTLDNLCKWSKTSNGFKIMFCHKNIRDAIFQIQD
jgi:hypothetical protein